MARVCFIALMWSAIALPEDKKDPAILPSEWYGRWTGKMQIFGPAGKTTDVDLELEIAPIDGSRDIKWITTYAPSGPKKMVKDYKLIPGNGPNRVRFDEKNGIFLDARVTNGVIYSQFEVAGSMLTARYELRGDRLRFEITSAKAGEKTGKGAVTSYSVEAVQSADLQKK